MPNLGSVELGYLISHFYLSFFKLFLDLSFDCIDRFGDRNLLGAATSAFKMVNTGPDSVRTIYLPKSLKIVIIP